MEGERRERDRRTERKTSRQWADTHQTLKRGLLQDHTKPKKRFSAQVYASLIMFRAIN